MTILLFLLVAALLILLNAFFVLAEFAAVKVRPSRVSELVDQGSANARIVQHIQGNLDEYLSVCQVGITLASIGLGFVGEPAFARLIEPALVWIGAGSKVVAHSIAISVAYVLVSFLHILVGEQVPKLMAIRRPDAAALWIARPLRASRTFLYLPLILLNRSTKAILGWMGLGAGSHDVHHSEEELRILLEESQEKGLISFRRLLLLENIFDLGDVKVRDAMRVRQGVKVLRLDLPWEENWKTVRETRFSRYPLLDAVSAKPLGVVHVKDLLYLGGGPADAASLRKLGRPYLSVQEDVPVEHLMADFQRRRVHLAMVFDREGKWTGFISLEDIIEEIIGTVEDEFEVEPPLFLSDALSAGRVVLGVQAPSLEEGIKRVFGRIPPSELPLALGAVERAVLERERAMGTYLGRGLAIPHARLDGIERAFLVFGRSEEGIPVRGNVEKAHLLFILLTPTQSPHIQARLLARIGGLLTSEYVETRLREAETPQGILEAIREGDPVATG